MRLALLLSLLAVVPAAVVAEEAKETNVFAHWSAQDLAASGNTLAAQKKDMASESLGNYGNHTAMLGYRQADGQAEVHEKKNDVFFVHGGEATLVTGGTVVDDKRTDDGEHRGSAIKDGKETLLKAGDVVHIPAGMPHQLLIKKGATFTYFVVKVEVPAKP